MRNNDAVRNGRAGSAGGNRDPHKANKTQPARCLGVASGGLTTAAGFIKFGEALIQDILAEKIDLETADRLSKVSINTYRFMDLAFREQRALRGRVKKSKAA